jgi:hypothetical protein
LGSDSGRGAFRRGRRPTGRTAGHGGRDDAGTSSDQDGENPSRRKPKGSWGRFIRPGLVGPKPRPRGVGEGQRVNSPVPLSGRYDRWGDAGGEAPPANGRAGPSREGGWPGQSGRPDEIRPRAGMGRPSGRERAAPTLPRKPSRETRRRPYRKPTQVGTERIRRCSGELSRRN